MEQIVTTKSFNRELFKRGTAIRVSDNNKKETFNGIVSYCDCEYMKVAYVDDTGRILDTKVYLSGVDNGRITIDLLGTQHKTSVTNRSSNAVVVVSKDLITELSLVIKSENEVKESELPVYILPNQTMIYDRRK